MMDEHTSDKQLEVAPTLVSTTSTAAGSHDGSTPAFDAEKHEKPTTLGDSEGSDDGSPDRRRRRASLTRVGSTRSGRSLSRTVSEVRDGIQNQRDLELAQEKEAEHTTTMTTTTDPEDPNLVRWDGPDDPENPKCWPIKRKWAAVLCGMLSFFTLISPVASSMVAPGLEAIGQDLHITSDLERALVLSIFVAAYALGPLLWGPLSELYGRVVVIQSSNAIFLLFNLGCGLARTEGQMIALRFMAGIGGGLLSDLFAAEQRGKAMSVYSLMPMLGPDVGPMAGGWIAERTSWRWVFYSTTVACGVIQAVGLFFLQETYAPVLLHRRKTRLVRATGNAALRTEYDHPERTLAQTLGIALTRPFRLLATQPIVQAMSLYMMYLYGMIYLVLSTFPALWSVKYHESPGIQGLNYLSLGVGFFLGAQLCAPLQDRIYAALKRRYVPDGGPGRPEFRVPMMVPGAVLVPLGLLVYSWAAEAGTHWIGPNVGPAVYAAGIIVGFQCVQGYMVGSYPRYAASAVGAMTVLRSLAGFGFPPVRALHVRRPGLRERGHRAGGVCRRHRLAEPLFALEVWRQAEGQQQV
ncbi:Putative transporter [Tolypocladium paradoxum]|uniref:Transporter n=1 Tax=Tolypocladium paradoxum TaxID=94208 RepID=A0A2S4KTY1_9HYPO|nr:Putative transporter [Tolypocladium paradoxum]